LIDAKERISVFSNHHRPNRRREKKKKKNLQTLVVRELDSLEVLSDDSVAFEVRGGVSNAGHLYQVDDVEGLVRVLVFLFDPRKRKREKEETKKEKEKHKAKKTNKKTKAGRSR